MTIPYADMELHPEEEPVLRCVVCGVPLPTDEAAIDHLNEALTAEMVRRRVPEEPA